jgi:ring-1,2-phenylacetyl-CoA epoxidase subunit PaaC
VSATEVQVVDVSRYALRLGDDALMLSQRLAWWCSRAPEIEEDIALANIALDLLGQARRLLAYAGELEGRGRSEDDLAYLREEREFTNLRIVELENGDFGQTIARQLLFSLYQHELYARLCGSSDVTVGGVAQKAVKEVAYHVEHATMWTVRLGDGTAESRQRMQAGLESVWPYAAEMFEPDELTERLSASGAGVDPASLRVPWQRRLEAVLTAATIERPEIDWRPTGGRRGLHGEGFGYLLAEMQHLHRAYPGASW